MGGGEGGRGREGGGKGEGLAWGIADGFQARVYRRSFAWWPIGLCQPSDGRGTVGREGGKQPCRKRTCTWRSSRLAG